FRFLTVSSVFSVFADAALVTAGIMSLEVGARVQVGDDKATVRYLGQVDGVRGDWVGVEWDDPARGKHDGTVKDKRYFTTRHPTGGSLVRPNLVSLGEVLETAVSRRYGSDENTDDFVLGTKRVEMVGLDKGRQRNLSALRVIVLDHMAVNGAVEASEPRFPRCEEVNLYGNLLRRWSDVVSILAHMPRCVELVLSANFLEAIPEGSELLRPTVHHESVLRVTLNRCRLDEATIARCLCLFPKIEELYAASNGVFPQLPLVRPESNAPRWEVDCHSTSAQSIPEPSPLPHDKKSSIEPQQSSTWTCSRSPNQGLWDKDRMKSFGFSSPLPSLLTLIDIEDNDITAFDDIRPLGDLPNLAKLSLVRCHLRSVRIASPSSFPRLHTLNLKGNEISDWESIGQLRQLRSLATLYIDFEKFHAEFGMDPREVIVAKLPSLKNLERCELSVIERRSAEIRYLNKYSSLAEERKREENHEEDLKRLEKEHGTPIMDNAKLKQMSIVKIGFVKGDKSLPERSLPTSLTVQKVLDMAKKLFRMGREEEVAAALDQDGFLIELEHVMRPLSFYEPQNGDLIRIRAL
ncbi:hypothetical protein PENTCL1PPCAC_19576, partial [Pristionchus entomophagus]